MYDQVFTTALACCNVPILDKSLRFEQLPLSLHEWSVGRIRHNFSCDNRISSASVSSTNPRKSICSVAPTTFSLMMRKPRSLIICSAAPKASAQESVPGLPPNKNTSREWITKSIWAPPWCVIIHSSASAVALNIFVAEQRPKGRHASTRVRPLQRMPWTWQSPGWTGMLRYADFMYNLASRVPRPLLRTKSAASSTDAYVSEHSEGSMKSFNHHLPV